MRNILITGGAGFFGQGLVDHLLKQSLSDRIAVFSRGEFNQSMMRRRLKDDQRVRWLIGDIRESSRLEWACQGIDVIFACAALKRIEVGFQNPEEMIKTNVIGTMNTIEAARRANVRKVVFLSSDKAFEPISPYGQSKALAESLILASNNTRSVDGPVYASCRWGNVMGSTGSIIPTWRAMIAEGRKRVPVTDPYCTRFAMLRQEAVELAITTAQNMVGGELIIPALPAFSLGDLAEAMEVDYDVIGLPDYEKKHESMSAGNSSERARRLSVKEIREMLGHV